MGPPRPWRAYFSGGRGGGGGAGPPWPYARSAPAVTSCVISRGTVIENDIQLLDRNYFSCHGWKDILLVKGIHE